MRTSSRAGAVRAAGIVLALVLALVRPLAGADSSPRSPEYLIKAAYLYNFAMFVEWPADAFRTAESPMAICVVGADPFGWALDSTVQGKRINGRSIQIERLSWSQDARHCHIVSVTGVDASRVGELVERLGRAPALVVADTYAARQPSAINFVVGDNKVGFEISLDQARRARLTISSKLLSLARAVR